MQHTTSPTTIHKSSPLDSLVRRTSSRRARANVPAVGPLSVPTTPPRPQADSPLLHTRFRTSTTTFSSFHDYDTSDARSISSRTERDDSVAGSHRFDTSPMPLNASTTFRPPGARSFQDRGESVVESAYSTYDLDDITADYHDSWHSSATIKPGQTSRRSSGEVIPTVVVSADSELDPEPNDAWPPTPEGAQPHSAGRTPSRVQVGSNINFSRPNLPQINSSEERKRQVLMRHQLPSTSLSPLRSGPSSPLVMSEHSSSGEGNAVGTGDSGNYGAPGASSGVSGPPSSSGDFRRMPQSAHIQNVLLEAPPFPPESQSVSAPVSPRPPSPASLYSSYSYYQFDSAQPSPTSESGSKSQFAYSSPSTLTPNYAPSQESPSVPQPTSQHTVSSQTPSNTSSTPQEYLQLGIQHHEANRLTESAVCFEKSATLQGGCGVGMLMWGLAQRHGWGCPMNERAGFRWLRRAAEAAVEDLEASREGVDVGAVKSELVLAIYEVGQSFYRGWGVEKDKEMAVSYFRVAARLGDPDAQQELAFCLANGKGCKKDKREAAKWYRAAVAQGASDIGLAWIYKEKYQ
ncbi:hypothetical protein AcW1_000110 [Taiwanofungus camphoratus]|nr:hypothetical protein AcW2_001398 [Antrodia cinnamomea]KAI0962861.1 hypothetical protein AcW1_000110 [Antrodia cinnamomea]